MGLFNHGFRLVDLILKKRAMHQHAFSGLMRSPLPLDRSSESPPFRAGGLGGRSQDGLYNGQNRPLETAHLPYVAQHSLPLCIKYFSASM